MTTPTMTPDQALERAQRKYRVAIDRQARHELNHGRTPSRPLLCCGNMLELTLIRADQLVRAEKEARA